MAHTSDCAVHNAPALPPGQCDCGDWPTLAEEVEMSRAHIADLEEELSYEKDRLHRLESDLQKPEQK